MTITVNDIKEYLRISHDIDDTFLDSLIQTAKDFIKEQTGVEYRENDNVYKQCIFFLTAHLYDNRASVAEKTLNETPYTLETFIKHIKIRGAKDNDE